MRRPLERQTHAAAPHRPTGPHVKLAGGSEAVNFVSFDFLGLAGDKGVQARSGTQNPWLSSAAR